MHLFVHIAGIGIAVIVVLMCPQSSALAQDYLNSPYQSEQFRYQEQQRNRERDEFYNRQRQQYQEQQLERRGSNSSGAKSESYGAIAYSPSTGESGDSYGYPTRAQAERRAMRECGKNDCKVAIWFANACAALSTSEKNEIYGTALNASEEMAKQGALANCTKDGGKDCKLEYSTCSR